MGSFFGRAIGKNFLHLDHDINALDHFRCSVIDTIIEDEKVNLKNIQGLNPQGKPKCLVFLALSILAASQMSEDDQEEISEKDYFTRLRSLLGLSGEGRPNGMKFGNQSEEILWKEWNLWLLQQGFQPTAYQGKGRSNKYIKYPISQTLFRQVDKDKLQKLFIEKQWTNSWDAPTLYSQVRHEINYLSKHIANLLRDRKRLELVADSLHEIHQQWFGEGCPKRPIKKRKNQYILSRNLFTGLYRTEDPFLGDIDYFLYPKQPKFKDNNEVKIQYHNQTEVLREDRQGWYLPCGSRLTAEDLNKGIIGTVINHNNLEKLILPAREFWILIRDKEDEDSDIYATYSSHPLKNAPYTIEIKFNHSLDVKNIIQEIKTRYNVVIYYSDLTICQLENLLNFEQWFENLPTVQGIIPSLYDWKYLVNNDFTDCLNPDKTGMYQMFKHNTEKSLDAINSLNTKPIATLFYDRDKQCFKQGDWYGLRFLTLKKNNEPILWKYDVNKRRLAIPYSQRFPELYERFLVLSSGILPSYSKTEDENIWLIYENISEQLLEVLIKKLSLSQPLSIDST